MADSADNTGTDDVEYISDDGKRQVSWSTVAMSVGLSALASAVVIGVGAVVMVNNSDNGHVTVISGDAAPNAAGVTSKKDANTTSAVKKTPGAPTSTSTAGAGATGSTGSTGGDPVRINGGGVPAPVDAATGGTDGTTGDTGDSTGGTDGTTGGVGAQSLDEGSTDVPARPSNGELKSQMESILAAGASDDQIAANLADPAGVQTIRDAGNAMRAVPIFRYEMVDPVVVEGDTMTATIQMSMIGLGSKPPTDLYYVARDGKWVLTNESVCLIASQARVSCSV